MPRQPSFPPEYFRESELVLETALNRLAAYKSWCACDPGPHYSIDKRYAAMPSLTKTDIRRHFPRGFVPAEYDIEKGLADDEISFVNSSGSTDARVTNIWNQQFWDASEKASWKLNSHTAHLATGEHPEAILVNPLNVGIISDDAELPMAKRRLARFLYLNEKTNPLLWTDKYMDRMIQELGEFKPVVLEANPTLLAKLSRYISRHNKTVFQPGVIVLTYEFPSCIYLRQISQVFKAPIASSFGTTETGYVFMQCEAGKFHQNTAYCRVDFQSLQAQYGGPLLGRLLVTPFHNPWYYIVRFDVGDLARLDETGECSCGRGSGLLLSAIEGRTANVTLTTKGRLVSLGELDKSLSSLDGIDEYSLWQTSPDSYRLHLVTSRADKNIIDEHAASILRNLYGPDAATEVVFKAAIPPESSGKYSLARTAFPVDIKSYLEGQ
jgi:phenylacetate-coenzyme A ligase PaaK-like adenylate-forming protein